MENKRTEKIIKKKGLNRWLKPAKKVPISLIL